MALASKIISVLVLSLFCCLDMLCVNATSYREMLVMGQSVGNSDTLVSKGGNYELGFFTRNRENSIKYYYVGIWFKKVANDKIVWVANRDYEPQTSSAFLTIHDDGNIVIIDGGMIRYVTGAPSNNNRISTYATLLDTGNLVLVNKSNQVILWQSFDNPTDTLLPGMTLGHDTYTGRTWSLRSWKRTDDPSTGPFTLRYDSGFGYLSDSNGSNVVWINDDSDVPIQEIFNQVDFKLKPSYGLNYATLTINSNSRFILEASGDLKYQAWSEEYRQWIFLQFYQCVTNNSCGHFSVCTPKAVDACQCLYGFEKYDSDSWSKGDRSAGCVRINKLSCNTNNNKDEFHPLNISVKSLPHHVHRQVDKLSQCNDICFTNCSCVLYAYDISNGNCMLWNDQVPTLKNTSTEYAYNNINNYNLKFFLRVAGPDRPSTSKLKEFL
ncbi:putative non-specific serine/threonine protein kinase [Medicago truncatula]|uniref:Putative non-specific serine/threonine protein kinase n=1 Tax=Medicago truncatula TaxID=3880 RepID=A0A396GIL7_MEDTR|nr:G-type lectin S-receptor-like serine/threonine-protein kinase At2g19130 [Medicago truncatula]RHN40989.1 putative non-specific serine/threonine protein kinase [Medicago truncatula]